MSGHTPSEPADLQLVFVYAGDSGLFNSVVHYAHKISAPQSYGCQLCMLTSGALGTEQAWTQFLKELALPAVFLHRDELAAQHPQHARDPFPSLYAQRGAALGVLAHAGDINACVDLQSLIALVRARVDAARSAPAADEGASHAASVAAGAPAVAVRKAS